MTMELGPALHQLALKMCVGAATLLEPTVVDDLAQAGGCLRGVVGDVHPLSAHYFLRLAAIDSARPSLAHSLYVEHVGRRIVGLLQYFGVFQMFCALSENAARDGRCALLGWLDPITLDERWEHIEPLELPGPPPGYRAEEIVYAQLQWTALLHSAAVQRGATNKLDVIVNATLPEQS